MIDNIVWNKLKPYKDSKNHSFEELCFQIAKGRYEGKGKFTSIDDSGGGDGVEFYLTLPNGDQWGWQAKFFQGNPRLSVSGRKPSIKKSLEKACKVHPNLKKWFLCTPTNFTTHDKKKNELDWFENILPDSIPEEMCVELIHWGDSDFLNWLSKPHFHGIYQFFFGKRQLNLDWFKTQFNKQKTGIGEKFDASLHTKIDVEIDIHAILGDHTFAEHITVTIQKLEEELEDLNDAIDNLNKPIQKDIVWDEAKKNNVTTATKPLQDVLTKTIDQFKHTQELLKQNMLFEAQAIDWDHVLKELEDALKSYKTAIDESNISEIEYTGESKYKAHILDDTTWLVHRPESIIANLLDDFLYSEIYKCKLMNHSELKIFGDAGVGKTHIVCNICEDRLKNGLPALFVRGNLFTDDQPIETQLLKILDIPSSYSFNDFMKALSAAAEAYNTRIPLFIDGLNEATDNGALSRVWEKYLKGFVSEIEQTKNVVLITTCRSSYKEVIWGDAYPPYSVDIEGFETDEVTQEAIEKYFKEYKIKADLTFAPLNYFKIPLYLKIFCEAKNRERISEVQVFVGEQTLFEVFDEYIEQCNEAVCKILDLHSGTDIVQSTLSEMAMYLWEHRSRYISQNELARIIDGESLDKLKKSSSKMFAIESEGLLVFRDMVDGTEVMRFSYDLLGGYLIAQYLVKQTSNRRKKSLQRTVSMLFGKHRRVRSTSLNRIKNFTIALIPKKLRHYIYSLERNKTAHPMYDDIGRSLAALLPAKTGRFLHQLSDNENAFGYSIRALFEISTDNINDECIKLVKNLFAQPDRRELFFKLAVTTVGHPKHPFNALFWSEPLSALSMSERDLSWTEHVREYYERFEKLVLRFEETCKDEPELSEIGEKRLHLLAEHIMWILTSTVRPLRDKATRALYWYGRRFPKEFFELVRKSFTINDPYVSERMLAATYGIAMAHHNSYEDSNFLDEELPVYGRELYENMFKPNAPHATTHILARDYAKRTIDIALIHHPDLLTDDEKTRIDPPYTDGGIREWGESENKNEGEYKKGPDPIQMDFEEYTLKSLIRYDNENPDEHKRIKANVYWRIYDLGFSLDSFGEIDQSLVEENYRKYGRSGDGRKTDRYGKKYSWIAYYEHAGFRQDNDLLPDYDTNLRILDIDIDPSFPDEQNMYNLVKEDFLGNRNVSHQEWVSKSNHPDLTNYLKVERFCDDLKMEGQSSEDGPWVLLWGSLSQEDKINNRDIFTLIQGVIVKPEETEEIVETFTNQEARDRNNMPFCPEDYYTYAGEVPWCDTYPENSCEEIQIEIGKVLVPEERVKILRNDKPIPSEEIYELWDDITSLLEAGDEESLKAWLKERNLEIAIEKGEVEETEYKTFEVLVPVRKNNWEDHRSAITPNRSVEIPSRQIAKVLGLCGQPQSFDLFEKENGKRASITFHYGKGWGEMQHFTYLRQDLLERYLEEIDRELMWIIWGERRQVSQNPDAPYKYFHEVKAYRDITKLSSK